VFYLLQLRRVPWTEKYRPRSLSEVYLPSYIRNRILSWWRAWKIWWVMFIETRKAYNKWLEFFKESEGRTFWNRYKTRWKNFFLREFETRFGLAARGIPKSHYELFESKGRYVGIEFKAGAKQKIIQELKEMWRLFLQNVKSKVKPPEIPYNIPPFYPALFVGPPGTGKTTTAMCIANDEGIEYVEFNASDTRTWRYVREIIQAASKSGGFIVTEDKPPRIILIDEVDGMSGTFDRGGFSALISMIDEARVPIIFAANDMSDSRVRFLMTKCITVFFDRPKPEDVRNFIRHFATRANIQVPQDVIERLIWAPDYRSIVEALETWYYTGGLPSLERAQMIGIHDAVRFAFSFKSHKPDGSIDLDKTIIRAKMYLSGTDMDPWEILLWVWENATKFVDLSNIGKFYMELAHADYQYKKGMLSQNWRVAYKILDIIAYAMAKYGREERNIWKLRRIKIEKPTIREELSKLYKLLYGEEETEARAVTETEEEEEEETEAKEEREEVAIEEVKPPSGIAAFLWTYARATHISRKEALRELRFLKLFAENNPEAFGRFAAQIHASRDSVSAFLSHFKIKSSLISRALKAYDEEAAKLAAKSLAAMPILITPVEAAKEEKKEVKKEAKEKVSKEEKKQQSLMEFLT